MALSLRLAGLGRLQTLVFDEVYYVPFALGYWQGAPSFDAHPPLAKYLIAIGIWLGQWPAAWFGWPTVVVNDTLVSPLAFRWLNAVAGATVPVLLGAIAWELGAGGDGYTEEWLSTTAGDSPKSPLERGTLTRPITPLFKGGRGDPLSLCQHRFALLAGLLMAMEGLTLVESRLALINIYGLALGLLGQWGWLRARHSPHPTRWRWTAGIAFGAAINVKWNWAGLWLGLVLWEFSPKIQNPKPITRNPKDEPFLPPGLGQTHGSAPTDTRSPHQPYPSGSRYRVYTPSLLYLTILPFITYLLLWLPHLTLTGESLMGVHRQLWSTHQSIGENASHAYCSPWHSWPLMLRPVAYFYERVGQGEDAIATTIHAMGNPVLWWLSTAAVFSLALGWLARQISLADSPAQSSQNAVVSFILLNYLANWLPWVLVSRCTFFYHAMGMVAFSTLGLAWLMAKWLGNPQHRPLALLLLGAIALSFFFWLPLYLGIPLSPEALQRRWLLPGWI